MKSHLYESFNARNYTPSQVAETFIASDDYEDLWRNEHSVVLGPRGSGKTTLFKMLTVQALYSWPDKTAKNLRNERPFTAVYVPTDMHWHHQLKHAEDHLFRAPRFSLAASRVAVTTSILLATARTFQDRLIHESSGNLDKEAELCAVLIEEWQLPKVLPCLDSIILKLKSRIAEIRALINEAIFRNSLDEELADLPRYFHLDYFSQFDVACSAFDAVFRLQQSPKWALCLDELELAPTWLQQLAFSQQRSSDDKYLIKLSTSPIPRVLGVTDSRPKQDVRLLCIWDHANRRGDAFFDRLSRSVISRRLGMNVSPEMLFGHSDLNPEEISRSDKYNKGSSEWLLFKDLATWDHSFRDLLTRYGVDPENPVSDDAAIKDSILRKAKPVALLRRAFLKQSSEGKISRRSRKVGTPYYGKEAIFKISDGNPRRLIGILGDMCSKASVTEGVATIRLSKNIQADVLTRASLHFSGYIYTLPGGSTMLGNTMVDLATLIRVIADFFRQRLLGPEFSLDPIGSFTVDSNINEQVVELLRLGVYHGALVYVDPVPDTIGTSLRGKRFRLSYMLSPLNRLPITLNDPISLSSILRSSMRIRVKRALAEMLQQFELPLNEER